LPLNPDAVKAADAALYQSHPELGARKLTMAPGDDALRGEWMKSYVAAGGEIENPSPPTPSATPTMPCPPLAPSSTAPQSPPPAPAKELRPVSRDGTKAFKRDASGNIVATKVGSPFASGHGGAPGTIFVLQEYQLELQDGSKVEAYKSLGVYDPARASITPDHRMDSDCHGVTFTNGEYWINNDQVDKTLSGGGFEKTTTPKPGDVAVYREAGDIVHSVTVTRVDSTGKVTEVSGLGGIEMKEHTDTPATAWGNPDATVEYYKKK
jgi:hypothetical protein